MYSCIHNSNLAQMWIVLLNHNLSRDVANVSHDN